MGNTQSSHCFIQQESQIKKIPIQRGILLLHSMSYYDLPVNNPNDALKIVKLGYMSFQATEMGPNSFDTMRDAWSLRSMTLLAESNSHEERRRRRRRYGEVFSSLLNPKAMKKEEGRYGEVFSHSPLMFSGIF
jgi:hypothetical protein